MVAMDNNDGIVINIVEFVFHALRRYRKIKYRDLAIMISMILKSRIKGDGDEKLFLME